MNAFKGPWHWEGAAHTPRAPALQARDDYVISGATLWALRVMASRATPDLARELKALLATATVFRP